jgi:hypothetical protein
MIDERPARPEGQRARFASDAGVDLRQIGRADSGPIRDARLSAALGLGRVSSFRGVKSGWRTESLGFMGE